ncbi:MAG: PDZ domain-containing protein, partial [Verrucomicrobiota bacterium]
TDEPLKPVTNWSKKQPKDMVIGSFLAAPSPDPETQSVVAIGLVSASNQNLSKEKGFLGVGLESTNDGGVSISGVIEDSPAAAAGLKTGDRIVAVDGKSTRNMTEVMRAISSLAPDTTVSITVKRGDKEWNIQPRLTKRPTDGQGAPGARFQAMDQMSGRLSKVKGGFPSAIQHDLPIAPEECGGPIVDLNGEVLGINIARAGRIKSYAIPASEIRQLLNMDTSEVAESPAVDSEEDAPPPNRVQDSRSVSQLEKDFDEALKGVEEARRALKKATDALRREKQLQRQ